MKKIIVLGGGYGGVLTAKKLAKRIQARNLGKEVSVTLVDKNPFHTLLTELHEVACGRVEEDSVRVPFSKIFAGRDVRVVCDTIKNIDYTKKELQGQTETYAYDYLVLSSGSKPAYYGVPGAEEYAFPLWSYDDAVRLRRHTEDMFRTASGVTDVQKRKSLLSFYIVGAGFTGAELAGELAEWTPILCERYGVEKDEVSITLVDVLGRVIPSLPDKQAKKAAKRLTKMGVEIKLQTNVTAVAKENIRLRLNGVEKEYPTRTVAWVAGVESSLICQSGSFSFQGRGRVVTDRYLRAQGQEDVYVVGDNLFYIPEGESAPVPQMVENCEQSAPVVANNIISAITGDGREVAYAPKFHGMMVSLGGRYGTAYVGTAGKKFGLPSFFAMLVKHFINLVYLVQVAGWNRVYSYLMHEIFYVPHRRAFTGGLFSNASPNFWLAPLRVFLGCNWIAESLPKISKVISDPTNIFLFKIPGDASTSATAMADVSGDAAAWGQALHVPDFIKGIVDWSMSNIIGPIAPVFQGIMVFGELIIGLMLVLGLFSAVFSILSAGMCVMIYASGMAPYEILWYFFGSIALIGGSGSVLGLDYYVMPYLKRQWGGTKFAKKWYLYND